MVECRNAATAPHAAVLARQLEPPNQGALEAPTGQQDAPGTAGERAELEDQPPGQQERIREG